MDGFAAGSKERLGVRKKRRGLTIVLILAGLAAAWCLYWYAAHAIAGAVADRLIAAAGAGTRSAECTGMRAAGFPLRIDLACGTVRFADERAAITGALDGLAIRAPLYRPGRIEARAAGPLAYTAAASGLDLTARWTAASLTADAGLDGLEGLSLGADQLALDGAIALPGLALTAIAAEDSEVSARPSGDKAGAYRIGAALKDIRLAAADGRALPSINFQADISAIDLGRSLGFDPKGTVLAWLRAGAKAKIDRLALAAGGFATEATGDLRLSDDGRLSGKLVVHLRNLDRLPDLIEAFRPGARKDAEKIVRLVGATTKKVEDENGPARETVLNFRDGLVSVGIIPVGTVPPVAF